MLAKNLFLIHCGFYDEEVSDGIYEFHVNIPVVAIDVAEAKDKIRENPLFLKKKMHIDGIQELSVIDGFRIALDGGSSTKNEIANIRYRDL